MPSRVCYYRHRAVSTTVHVCGSLLETSQHSPSSRSTNTRTLLSPPISRPPHPVPTHTQQEEERRTTGGEARTLRQDRGGGERLGRGGRGHAPHASSHDRLYARARVWPLLPLATQRPQRLTHTAIDPATAPPAARRGPVKRRRGANLPHRRVRACPVLAGSPSQAPARRQPPPQASESMPSARRQSQSSAGEAPASPTGE